MQQLRKNKWDIVRDQGKTFMSIETIASMSHKVSIVSYIVGAKEVFILFNYKVPPRKFLKKYILSLWIWAWYRKKMVFVQKVIHIKKITQKLKKNFLPPFYEGDGFLNFVQNLFSTLYNTYFSHRDRSSRFREN